MTVMNFDLEDGKPPVTFTLKPADVQRFVAFMAECNDALKRIAELEKTASEQEKDAARYRHIRSHVNNGFPLNGPKGIGKFEVSQKVEPGHSVYHAMVTLDAAIDAAMQGKSDA